MSSLKGYVPGLASILGTTPGVLYERQRALVRAGLLDQSEGRGPGSGVRATDSAIAMLLVSVLASERVTGSEEHIRAIAYAKTSGGRCQLTGQRTFINALADVLRVKVGLVDEIAVSRTAGRALIRYRDMHDDTASITEFGTAASAEPGVSVSATVSLDILHQIARDVQAIVGDEMEGEST